MPDIGNSTASTAKTLSYALFTNWTFMFLQPKDQSAQKLQNEGNKKIVWKNGCVLEENEKKIEKLE